MPMRLVLQKVDMVVKQKGWAARRDGAEQQGFMAVGGGGIPVPNWRAERRAEGRAEVVVATK